MLQSLGNCVKRLSSLSARCCALLLVATSSLAQDRYDRKDFNYQRYKPSTSIGFYTNQTCDFINIDHIVSLKDAYDSGAASWGASKN